MSFSKRPWGDVELRAAVTPLHPPSCRRTLLCQGETFTQSYPWSTLGSSPGRLRAAPGRSRGPALTLSPTMKGPCCDRKALGSPGCTPGLPALQPPQKGHFMACPSEGAAGRHCSGVCHSPQKWTLRAIQPDPSCSKRWELWERPQNPPGWPWSQRLTVLRTVQVTPAVTLQHSQPAQSLSSLCASVLCPGWLQAVPQPCWAVHRS